MGKVDKDKAAKTGDFLFRYMWTRHRCTREPAPADAAWLAYLIEWGNTKFDNVYIDPDVSPPIVWDNKHPAFFSAMVSMDHGAMSRPADLAAWRSYVLYNSLPPERPLQPPEPAARVMSDHDVIAEVWGKRIHLSVSPPRWRLRGFIPLFRMFVRRLETERA